MIFNRYKVYVRAVDETGSATFIIFDRDVSRLIAATAYVMRGNVVERGDQFPEELNDMAGQKVLIEFKVTKAWNLDKKNDDYTVGKLSKDNSLIESFNKVFKIDEV